MFRLFYLLALWPSFAAAEWSQVPRAFSYATTFDRCTVDPARVDTGECADFLRDAYVLNRAVVRAVQSCKSSTLDTCPVAFEEEGLPAIAATIAVTSGCDNTDVARFEAFIPLPENHCITTIFDILYDEGVVPFNTDLHCGFAFSDCADLRDIHANLWAQAIKAILGSHPARVRTDTAWNKCFDQTPTDEALILECYTAQLGDIWVDLTLQSGQDN